MAQECPAWLDETFLASALQSEDGSQVTIVKFSVKPAVAAGDNYMSHMYRVRVEYTVAESESGLQTTSLIVKIPISKGAIMDVLDSSDFYAKEPRIYNELLPKFRKLVNCEFGPTVYNCPIENGMILQDLNALNYIMCDKMKQLDFSHCKLVYKTLAKFHASSVACYHNDPELIKGLGEDKMRSSRSEMFHSFIKSAIKHIRKYLDEAEGCKYAKEFLLNRADHVSESITNMLQPKMNGLNVLNHGDLWINNLLFKYSNSKEVEDVKFIDFQNTRWGSMVPDLIYFLWTSANEEVREHKQNELYSYYRESLNSNLEQLGCPERLSAQELEDDLRAASDFVLVIISGTVPFVLSGPEDTVNMENLSSDEIKSFDIC
ncbi:uncharacterized protein LOC124362038 [Homalodisca vitripennis]|uniref:uncharacterized protein LOC124362038 n=1 Tax=Homalodisca vitripennis TaxID=197043 RepID=UPI001EEAD7C7|nr:uncharacterized protein LOC124362038 [Homalodisca vitripennis]XP_046672147.1 uncharacterized protein LOC124362038 [Homalodisca vitripennis]XP_046672148.1 uncharacterized protein LOC124362038 [Homalodisca vitripennis]XP_046672149.1 uncharacterized protein LOC124362038 [Homalodisca vitripennis]XP_046672150.1 uncharacterized protein LOC124362038 [Homalodisca vitripennis]